MAQAFDRAVVAQETQEAERHVAEDRQDLGCIAGVDAAGILAEDDLAHPVQAVFDAPMAAHEGSQTLGIGLSRGQAGDTCTLRCAWCSARVPKITLTLRTPVRLSIRCRSRRKTCCKPGQPYYSAVKALEACKARTSMRLPCKSVRRVVVSISATIWGSVNRVAMSSHKVGWLSLAVRT